MSPRTLVAALIAAAVGLGTVQPADAQLWKPKKKPAATAPAAKKARPARPARTPAPARRQSWPRAKRWAVVAVSFQDGLTRSRRISSSVASSVTVTIAWGSSSP